MDIELAMLSSSTWDAADTAVTGMSNKHDRDDIADTDNVCHMVCNGKYEEVLTHQVAESLLKNGDCQHLDDQVKENVRDYLAAEGNQSVYRELNIIAIAVSSLQLYVQNNWVGPPSKLDPTSVISEKFSDTEEARKNLQKEISDGLSIDGEEIYRLSVHPIYLYLAKTILCDCLPSLKQCQTSGWWLMRCLRIQQLLLEERSPTLKNTIMQLIKDVENNEILVANESQRERAMCFHIEAGHLCYFYYEPSEAKKHFNLAIKLSGLDIGLSGALGKRTRFQENEISQLVLKVKRLGEDSDFQIKDSSLLPKDLRLGDDTVLDKIQFQESRVEQIDNLRPSEQALVLALLCEHQKFQEGVGDLILEESLAYINCVLSQPQSWSVQTTALLMRSQLENVKTRALERCLAQLEELVNQFKRDDPNPHERLGLVYAVNLPPVFQVERQLGNFFIKVGATNAALEVFLRLEMWEDIIKCYITTGRQEKAEKVIREQLSVKETPELLCYLGDVLHEVEQYQKAWELSDCHCAKAQRNMAYLYMHNGKHELSLPCFEKSLKINALQIGVWFSYGCAALACEEFDIASTAFRRCVTLEPDNHEGWNNLATAFIRAGQKPKGFLTLQEALKCDFENWRIWENYLLVGTDVGEFEEVIKAYHRLLDIKNKHEDVEVLQAVGKAINSNIPDAHEKPAGLLRTKFLTLMGRVTSKVTTNGDIWRLYGETIMIGDEVSQTDRERALQYLQKSHRCNTQSLNWEKDVEKCKKIAGQSTELATAYLTACDKTEDHAQASRFLSSAKLMLKGVLSKIKQRHIDPITKELLPELLQPYNSLDEEFSKILVAVEERKVSINS